MRTGESRAFEGSLLLEYSILSRPLILLRFSTARGVPSVKNHSVAESAACKSKRKGYECRHDSEKSDWSHL